MKKSFFIILVILLLVAICLIGCNKEEVNQRALINEYIKNNETTLIETASEIMLSEEINEKNIIKKLPKDIKICGIYKSDQNDYIDFAVDEGFTSSSHYYGFYYSPKDVPLAAGFEDKRLQEDGNGYRIQEPDNEDWYYTEKIIDNFYFYEDHY